MKSKKVVLAVLMLLIFATNSYSTNSTSTNKYDNYPRVGISVGLLNDSMIEIKCESIQ